MRTTVAVFLALALTTSAQQPPQAGGEQVFVTAIDVVADVRDANGKLPAGLKPGDFVVIEDGVERTVVGLDYLRAERIVGSIDTSAPAAPQGESSRPWQNVIYFETTLANGQGRVGAARQMMNHVDTLIQMGTVDVVFANPIPVALVRNSRDAAAIRAALEKVATSPGINQLAAHRRDYMRDVMNLSSVSALKSRAKQLEGSQVTMDMGKSGSTSRLRGEFDSSGAPQLNTLDSNSVRPYIDHEIRLINSFRESLMTWLSSYRRHVPRNLLVVTDGYDLDPVEFYAASSTNSAQMDLRAYVSQSTLGDSAERMAQTLAAAAWTTVSIPSDNNADGWVDDATVSAIGRVHASLNRQQGGTTKAFLIRPLDPLNAIAESTGGKVVSNSAHLGGVLESLDDRVKLTYQVDRKPDGKTRKIEVRARDKNLKVRTAHYATSATPESMAETRAVGLLKTATYTGDLSMESTVEWTATTGPKKSGTLRALTNVDLVKRLLPPGAKGQFRITLAVQLGKEAIVVNRAVSDYDLTEGVFRFRTPLDLPAKATALILVIEETTTGVWGSTRVTLPGAPAS